jgi:L-malate glycosyltransferase
MKILHITSHLGGGVGTVILDWMEKINPKEHTIVCLDYANDKAMDRCWDLKIKLFSNVSSDLSYLWLNMEWADVVLVHFWDHPMLLNLLHLPMPLSRMIFWQHKNYNVEKKYIEYPDRFIVTSPVIGGGRYESIWSTGNMEKYINTQPVPHGGFNVGYVGTVDYKKIYNRFMFISLAVRQKVSDVNFTFVGKNVTGINFFNFDFVGQKDDVIPYFAQMDVFGYPLRPDHYGTCEQVLGEAMACGIVPVVMNNEAEKLIVQDGVTGFIATSEQEYIEHIEHLYNKPLLRHWMSDNCRDAAAKIYDIDLMVAKWNVVFEQMMSIEKRERKT